VELVELQARHRRAVPEQGPVRLARPHCAENINPSGR
jgi:hypothetical protein